MGRNDKRKYQRNCAFRFKRKRVTWNKKKNKTMIKSSHQRCSVRKGVLRNFGKFTGIHRNTCDRVSFLIKLQLYLKRDSGTGAFL